jgi:hypothetical protein
MMPALTSFLTRDDDGLKSFLESEGQHPAEDIVVQSGHDLSRDCYRIDVYCRSCERKWTLDITHQYIFNVEQVSSREAQAMQEEAVIRQIVPFLKQIARTLCFRFSLAAELAEWLTKRVAEAGAKGVKYSALVAEAVDMHLCDERDITAMLERLGFRMDFGGMKFVATPDDLPTMVEVAHIGGKLIHDGWVTLPFDHPLLRGAK